MEAQRVRGSGPGSSDSQHLISGRRTPQDAKRRSPRSLSDLCVEVKTQHDPPSRSAFRQRRIDGPPTQHACKQTGAWANAGQDKHCGLHHDCPATEGRAQHRASRNTEGSATRAEGAQGCKAPARRTREQAEGERGGTRPTEENTKKPLGLHLPP